MEGEVPGSGTRKAGSRDETVTSLSSARQFFANSTERSKHHERRGSLSPWHSFDTKVNTLELLPSPVSPHVKLVREHGTVTAHS